MKKIFMTTTLFLICFLAFNFNTFATSSNYEISKYNVDINVNSNNSFDISEDIYVHFNVPQHGIYREIPTRNNIVRADGSKAITKAVISNFTLNSSSGVPYTVKKTGLSQTYKFGDANAFEKEDARYLLKYNYDLGEDNNDKFDELYFNIIGTQWYTSISDVTFSITMPKKFDESKLGFTYGPKGSFNTDNIEYSVDGNVITGRFNGTLMPKQGLTVRLELPEGYFIGERENKNPYSIFLVISPIFVVIGFALWFLFGRDAKIFPSVQFYPPEGYNSAEVAFLYHGKIDSNNVASLIVYLASKGYLKIVETEKRTLLGTKASFQLEKVKEYDGNNPAEKIIFKGLFPLGIRTVTEPEDLKNIFYQYINSAKATIETKDNKDKIFEKSSRHIKPIIILLAIITLTITFMPLSEIAYGSVLGVFFPVVFLIVLFKILLNLSRSSNRNISDLIAAIVSSSFVIAIFIFFVYQPLSINPQLIPFVATGIICTTILLCFFSISLKRTDFGIDIIEKIVGFKNFLNVSEKDSINQLANDDPEYFYNILPFAYVLGVSDTWITKFESISLEPPSWYQSSAGYFSADTFSHSFSSVMRSVNSSATSAPYSSSSGSSGGGSSGGGSGGGGGGSW